MSTILDVITFILVLGVIIFVHELGHLIFAKKYNVYCPEFAIGMGPVIYARQVKETKYSLRAFPVGGYVVMAGEDDDGKEVEEGRRIFDISKPKQMMVMFAGAFFNFILGFLLLLIIGFTNGVLTDLPIVGEVVANSDASNYNINPGDTIIAINDVDVNTTTEAANQFMEAKSSGAITIEFLSKETKDYYTIEINDVASDYMFGIVYDTTRNPVAVFTQSISMFITSLTAIFSGFVSLFTNFNEVKDSISGPVGIYNFVGEARTLGFTTILAITSLLSINIGLLNLIPFPGLDGSKIVIAFGEMVFKRDLPKNIYIILSLGGLVALLSLMVFITYLDVMRIIG